MAIKRKWDYDWKSYQNKGEFNLSDEQIKLLHSVCENNITILTHDAELKVRMSLLTNENKTANYTKQIFDIKLTKYATAVQN